MKKEFLFLMIMTFSLIGFVSGAEFQKSSSNNAIIPEFNQPAKIDLTITGVSSGTYHFYTFADLSIFPEGTFKLSSEENNLEILLYPQDRIRTHEGFYTFIYNLKKDFGTDDYEDKMTIKVVPLKEAIEIGSNEISPDAEELVFYIQNKEKAKLTNVSAKFISVFFNIERTFDLNPLEKTEIRVKLDKEETKKIRAGIYLVNADFSTDIGKVLVEGKIYWGEKKGITSQESSEGFFIKHISNSKLNIGSVPQAVEIKITKGIISRLFTSFNIRPSSTKRNGLSVTYSWTKELGPAESLIVKAKTNYILPTIILILIIIIIYCYVKYTERKVEVIKSVSHVKTKGGEFALKVRIRVKAKKNIDNVSLVDRIPAMTKIYEKLWAVEPKKVDTINRRIYWDLGDMHVGEERIFSYVIFSKVGVIGKFTLPEAMVILEKDGKIKEVTSNKVFFLSEQVAKND